MRRPYHRRMRSIVVAVTLFLSLAANAAPHLEFFTDHPNTATHIGASVYVHNDSAETAHDVEVRIEWPADLGLSFGLSVQPRDWTCETFEAERYGICRIDAFAPDDFAGVYFMFRPAQTAGGHYGVTATLTSRETERQVVLFDVISPHTHTITSAEDSGPGTLRDAIEEVNANPLCGTDVPCSIGFGGREAQPITIAPLTPLPPIRKCNVQIFGYDDPEFPSATKRVVISGERAQWGNGLEVRASCAAGISGVHISSLVVHSWPWNGIQFDSPAEGERYAHTVNWSYIGTDETGLVAKPNGWRGITVDSPYERVTISSSIISGNARSGITLWAGKKVLAHGVKLGVNRLGEPLGNGASGIASFGVPFELASSTVAHNAHFGVAVTPGTIAKLEGNAIYANTGLPVDFGLDGRTPDDDETDGVVNAPRLLDAYYDDATGHTVVKGVVRLRAGAYGGGFGIYFFRATNERGDAILAVSQPRGVVPPLEGVEDVPFEFEVDELPRGSFVSAMTTGGETDPTTSSEISEAIRVR